MCIDGNLGNTNDENRSGIVLLSETRNYLYRVILKNSSPLKRPSTEAWVKAELQVERPQGDRDKRKAGL